MESTDLRRGASVYVRTKNGAGPFRLRADIALTASVRFTLPFISLSLLKVSVAGSAAGGSGAAFRATTLNPSIENSPGLPSFFFDFFRDPAPSSSPLSRVCFPKDFCAVALISSSASSNSSAAFNSSSGSRVIRSASFDFFSVCCAARRSFISRRFFRSSVFCFFSSSLAAAAAFKARSRAAATETASGSASASSFSSSSSSEEYAISSESYCSSVAFVSSTASSMGVSSVDCDDSSASAASTPAGDSSRSSTCSRSSTVVLFRFLNCIAVAFGKILYNTNVNWKVSLAWFAVVKTEFRIGT
ncbi:uncharacterized protein EV422DRAFT_519587 [Fimicolochytrium jonesii]|uniref:uncharacterized protein n=1 Tax=Fimicolochytrium jonesii TaxID=1396493 RepID=UPI0022FDC837|nr:uncharacterized protein EV422DRAFT_519587 [Fimicolochytrium jonesii]KAI8824284.1 hypothetical protein EV422DRAFT_519587 [Fimicolochytrium jonesii]